MHVIKLGEVNNSPLFRGRVTNRSNLQDRISKGYEIVRVPVMVDNRASWNQKTPPEPKDLDYLMEIPEKIYKEGQKTKQLQNDLLTYDVTGSIGKDLHEFTERKKAIAVKEAINSISVWAFLKLRVQKICLKK